MYQENLYDEKTEENSGDVKYSTPVDAKLESNEETDSAAMTVMEKDTSATLTAIANNPESFQGVVQQQQNSVEDDSEEFETPTQNKPLLATGPPILLKTSKDVVLSKVSDDGEEDYAESKTNNKSKHQQPKKEESYEPDIPTEVVQDRSSYLLYLGL